MMFLVVSTIGIVEINALDLPKVHDPSLQVIPVVENIPFFPSNMAFSNSDEILLLDKNNGTVVMVKNGTLMQDPLLRVNVSSASERGLLGIAIDDAAEHNSTNKKVFLYYTEIVDNSTNVNGNSSVYNRLYSYDLVNNTLLNPVLLLELLAEPGVMHNGGALTIGPDKNIYIPYGDMSLTTETQNNIGVPSQGTGGIVRVTQDGKPVNDTFSLGEGNLTFLYGYGIRNSFGIDFDPLTGKLWDTENGPDYGDEINLIEPGFNGGWKRVQGEWSPIWSNIPGFGAFMGEKVTEPQNLVDFDGKGVYRAPEFMTGNFTIGPTAIKFLSSNVLGKNYQNDMFVGDIHNGNLYRFKLNEDRNGFDFNGTLLDKVADDKEELKQILFGEGFGGITDIEEGPDGYLYVLSAGKSSIFKIVPN